MAIPFHPYYTVKDLIGLTVFLIVFASIIFFAPEMGGYFLEHNNFVPAESISNPRPYCTCLVFHSLLFYFESCTTNLNSQFPGVAAMGLSVLILFPSSLAG
jgi:ubiquinol-cytochrome c reductase cytochrome b subunit